MSKYPWILFFTRDESIKTFLKSNELNCTLFFVDTPEELNKMYDFNYSLLVTYGPDEFEFNCGSVIANRMRDRWIHFKEINDITVFNNAVNYCFIHNCSLPRSSTRPTFSIFTTCYNSYDKILRAYNSLKFQTLKDYEWVIIDDSPDDSHFNFLKSVLFDNKVRLYRRSCNSGNIGNVKNEAVSLCRGKYILELDHDDEILPDVLKDSVEYFEEHPEIGFIYMDFINIYENGDNFFYGDFICKGYGSYYTQKYKGKWVYVYNTPQINNITLSHLVCCPNHPRIWRTSVLLEAGNYSEFLSICDDYEILLRTAAITKMAKLSTLGYVQYMNEHGNNFSLIRNGEINRIGPQFIQPIFYEKFNIHERMKDLGGYEDPKYIYHHSKIHLRKNYTPQFANEIYKPRCEKQVCVIGIENIHKIYPLNKNYDYIVLDTIPLTELQKHLDDLGDLGDFVKCYSLPNMEELENYFNICYRSCEETLIISGSLTKTLGHHHAEDYPFPHTVLDNFLQTSVIKQIEQIVKNMDISHASYKFCEPEWENNKYAFQENLDPIIENLLTHLVSDEFVDSLERLTGITGLIRNDILLKGAGVHKITNEGVLGMHTDFNTYDSEKYGLLDRRINLLLYLNNDWKPEYNGYLSLADFDNFVTVKKIAPILNRCVIFNTSSKSLHGHPEPLNVPEGVTRNSIALYYYTKNVNGLDFEGLPERKTMIYKTVDIKPLKPNTEIYSRAMVINKNTKQTDIYLEIGVEYGQTFQDVHFTDKTGVDPDPKCENIVKMDSDTFFSINKINEKTFDVIFIDGMHQAEYLLRDFNNSLKVLNEHGTIFIDDILPLNYDEQLKIPKKFIHENGILKYNGVPWTGDVWKVVFHILKNYRDNFVFGYYSHENYRGIGMFKIKTPFEIPLEEIETINNYNYSQFNEYTFLFERNNGNLRIWSWWSENAKNTNIVLNEDFLFIQIPKCSSTNIAKLCKGVSMDAYKHEGIGYLKHFIKPGLPVYALVRNPYTQIYSYYFHSLKWEETELENLTLKENFKNFVKMNIDNPHVCQYNYVKDYDVRVFKMEEKSFIPFLNEKYNLNLDTDFKSNVNEHPLYDKKPETIIDYYDNELIELVTTHRKLEFEMFGYSTDISFI